MLRSSGRLLGASTLAVVILAVVAAWPRVATDPRADAPATVAVTRVPLDPTDQTHGRVGKLVYRGGLWLRSADPRFGGLSDLRVSEDGNQLRAVSDCGRGFVATLSYDEDGRLSGLGDPDFVDLVDPDGRLLTARERDAESLVANDSSLEVGFEGTNRILAYASAPPFAAPAAIVPTPPGLRGCGSNGGIETMALLDPGRRFLVCETRRQPSEDVPAWIGEAPHWTAREYPLLFEDGWGAEPFRPTSAARLPNGDLLVLERRFPPIGARVVRLERDDLAGRGPLHPREIARLESPLTLDNFEGIDVRLDAGRTLVYVVSDDNNCAKGPGRPRGTGLQRTLLLMFSLEP